MCGGTDIYAQFYKYSLNPCRMVCVWRNMEPVGGAYTVSLFICTSNYMLVFAWNLQSHFGLQVGQ